MFHFLALFSTNSHKATGVDNVVLKEVAACSLGKSFTKAARFKIFKKKSGPQRKVRMIKSSDNLSLTVKQCSSWSVCSMGSTGMLGRLETPRTEIITLYQKKLCDF